MERADVLEPAEAACVPPSKQPHAEPVPGYRLIERLGRGGFGEVWKCEAPGGLFKAIKFVAGASDPLGKDRVPADEELRAVQHIKAIRHPFLLSMERVESVGGELVIVMELADKSLHDLCNEYRAARLPGIPRNELLCYLREAAEVLDVMNIRHGLQHLDIKPSNLFLVSNHMKVADFGLVNSLGGPQAGGSPRPQLSAVTPLYASPEIFQGTFSAHSDQYSLAIVYQELLTGTLPFKGKNSRQLLIQHAREQPDLDSLPEADRTIVARALSKDPQQRFPSCTEFVQALLMGTVTADSAAASLSRVEKRLQESLQETRANTTGPQTTETQTHPFPADGDAVPGYRFLACVGCSPLAEVWEARAPDGRKRLVNFLYGFARRDPQQAAEAVARLKSLQYPVLAPAEIVRHDPGRLVVVSDLLESSLWNRFQECQSQGLPGLPRPELLGYLRTAAEALDYLYQQHAIQHLALNPRNLLLDRGRLLIGNFGLVQLLWLPAGQPVTALNARFSAPELLEKRISRSCDLYSLALIFCELLTGCPALRQHKPDLAALPTHDRDIIARALDPDPNRRWASSLELVRVLKEAAPETAGEREPKSGLYPVVRAVVPPLPQAEATLRESADRVITELVAAAGTASALPVPVPLSSSEEFLLSQFSSPLPVGSARLKLEAFRQECDALVVREEEGELVFRISRPRNFWQQCLGRQPGLEVYIRVSRPRSAAATPIDVSVQIAPFGCGRKHGTQILQETGRVLLESLRTCLQVDTERRTQERLIWHQPLPVRPILTDGQVGDVIACRGKDISRNGIGFYVPRALPTTQVYIELPATTQSPSVTVPASIVRVQRCGDGWYDVGALFLRAANSQGK